MARVLVVDDEALCVMLLSRALEEEGHQVATASNGDDAIRVGTTFHPELLITDWKLGTKKDGLDVSRALRAVNSNLDIILISGLPEEEIRQQASDLVLFDVLEKPCGLDDTLAVVRQALARDRNKPTSSSSPA